MFYLLGFEVIPNKIMLGILILYLASSSQLDNILLAFEYRITYIHTMYIPGVVQNCLYALWTVFFYPPLLCIMCV